MLNNCTYYWMHNFRKKILTNEPLKYPKTLKLNTTARTKTENNIKFVMLILLNL